MEFTQEVKQATDPIYQKISKVMPEIEWSVHAPYIHKINKLKNKLTKRLLPINIIDGKLHEGEGIFNKENEIGKVLINNEYPFALIKFLDKNFNENAEFKTKEASIKIKKPEWIDK